MLYISHSRSSKLEGLQEYLKNMFFFSFFLQSANSPDTVYGMTEHFPNKLLYTFGNALGLMPQNLGQNKQRTEKVKTWVNL